MFRTPFILDFVLAVAVERRDVLGEERVIVHHGQRLLQEVAVEGVLVVAPQVGNIPGTAGLDALVAPSGGAAEDIVLHSHGPATCLAGNLCGQSSPRRVGSSSQVDDVVEERTVHFAEVGGVSRPVVHFDVDVGMNVAVPETGVRAVIPDTLQVAGRMDGSVEVGTDGHVAAILEVEAFEEEPLGSRLVAGGLVVELDEVFGSLFADGSEREFHTVHQFAVLGHMGSQQLGVVLGSGSVDALLHLGGNLFGGFAAHAAGLGCIVISGGSHDQVHPVGTLHVDTFFIGRNGSSFVGQHLESRVVSNDIELAAELCSTFGIAHRAGIDELVGHVSELQRQFVGAFSLVVGHEHAVGGRSEVAALVACGFVTALVIHAAHTVDDVEVAYIFLDGLGVVGQGEVAALVNHLDGTEVLEIALIAISSGSGPKGLFVELDFVLVESATDCGAHLSVAERQGILHPRVAHAGVCHGHVVPEREVIDVGRTLAGFHGVEFGIQHLLGGDNFSDVESRAVIAHGGTVVPQGEVVAALIPIVVG